MKQLYLKKNGFRILIQLYLKKLMKNFQNICFKNHNG